MIAVLALAAALGATSAPDAGMASVAPGGLEARPRVSELSPLQARIDAAAPGATIEVLAGTYRGDLYIDRPVRLVGRGRPLLSGSGAGSVVRVRADGVSIEGFDVDGRGGGDLGRDSAGVHVAARNVTLRDVRIRGALFGIYLREANGARVLDCSIRGIPGLAPGEKGSGIHVWNTDGFTLAGNDMVDVRDGFYIQSSTHGRFTGNRARDLRYGLHFMYSDDHVFEDNTFENGAAGTAIMYSRRIVFRRNRFLRNRGFASVGLLFKNCDDVLAEDNLLADNARGVFLEGSNGCVLRGNVIAQSDAAVVLYDSCTGVRFERNAFVGNLSPLNLVGRRTDTVFDHNYWSDNAEPDLDGDGVTDRAYALSSVFDHFRGNLLAADLFAQGLAASLLGVAESSFPVLDPTPVEDRAPLARPPALPRVPVVERARSGRNPAGLAGAGLLALCGASLFWRTSSRRTRP